MNDSETKYYKAFDKDLRCLGMQYEIGKEYAFGGKPILCLQGFHFCKSIADCYIFYDKSEDTRICEVLPLGDIDTNGTKYCTNKIKILAEIEDPRLKTNVFVSSTGYCNTGNRNNGHYNSGDYNIGDSNTGNWNNGSCNTGEWNSGDCNTGNWNNGACNTGSWNSGFYNTGEWNSGFYSSGIFNTERNAKIKTFDQESHWTFADWCRSNARRIMAKCPQTCFKFISKSDMTDKEKEKHPEYKILDGYMKKITITKADKQKWWDDLSNEEKEEIYSLPNFNANKFNACTGIKVNFPANKAKKQKSTECVALDKLDEIITDALDKSTDQKESQTLRWVLDKISEVKETKEIDDDN